MYSLSRSLRNSIILPLRGTVRSFSVSNDSNAEEVKGTEAEKKIASVLQKRFANAKAIRVEDVSGGCGAMFNVAVISPEFKDISIVKQHQMVNQALKDEIKQMHGIRIYTASEMKSNE